MRLFSIRGLFGTFVLLLFLSFAAAQDCSASNPCAAGCCSKYGYCGIGPDHCGADVCVSNCDYQPTNQCSETKLCETGCCNQYGICGFGPDYCGAENCVSTCDAKAECDPSDWGSEYVKSTKCPLNVCCSEYGFCGTTEEFCGDEKVTAPSCSKSHNLPRVVGYYEGWSPTRPCKSFWPEQIPPNVYTHLNYAFASINPTTYEVVPANQGEIDLMQRLTSLKGSDLGLRVNIAIGGWSFNSPGPTATVFSDLAASEEKQRVFIKSLTSFMATYDFDGVDIDWEYPVATNRSGRPEDYENFPKFMANVKSALKSTGGRDELSLTLPTSYWYLQHFDIKALEKSVDYFNYMAYDLHGTWDKGNKWTGAYLDSHTNLTELKTTLDLLWRNDIDPEKVVLGMAFYGRAFTVADTGCMSPGCTFSSGSDPGPCSKTSSMLMNSEIVAIAAERNIEPTLYEDAATQVLTWDDQWVGFDNAETFHLRTEFARKTCLGGVMVWAVSQDTFDANFSQALTNVAPHAFPIMSFKKSSGNDTVIEVEHRHRQCKWSGCGQICSGDYVAVSRSDSNRRDGELMLDSTGCVLGVHTLCCPKQDTPKCGWYGFNNGGCDHACPGNMFEIGSYSGACNNGDYQAACCETGHKSTALYSKTLEWTGVEECSDGTCPWADSDKSEVLAISAFGSGDADCYDADYSSVPRGVDGTRKLCYDPNEKDMSWEDCSWFDSVGSLPSHLSNDYCSSDCPTSKVRLSMGDCDGGGGRAAFCCADNYYTTTTKQDPEIAQFEEAAKDLISAGKCPMHSGDSSEELGSSALTPRGNSLTFDDLEIVSMVLARILSSRMYSPKSFVEKGMWDRIVEQNGYESLQISTLKPYVEKMDLFHRFSAQWTARDILCRPRVWAFMVSNDGDEPAACLGDPCDEGADPELCQAEEEAMGPELVLAPIVDADSVEKRDNKYYKVWCSSPGQWSKRLAIYAPDYPKAGKWKPGDIPYDRALTWVMGKDDCSTPLVYPQVKVAEKRRYNTEHIIELKYIPLFFEYATKGMLISGKQSQVTPIDCNFFLPISMGGYGVLDRKIIDLPAVLSGMAESRPAPRIMNALGSNWNKANFHLVEAQVNGMKMRLSHNTTPNKHQSLLAYQLVIQIFQDKQLADPTKMHGFMRDLKSPGRALKEIKSAIGVWHYLNNPDVKKSFVQIERNVRRQLNYTQHAWKDETGNKVPLVNAWHEFFDDMIPYHRDRTSKWVHEHIAEMTEVWENSNANPKLKAIVLSSLRRLDGFAYAIIDYDLDDFHEGDGGLGVDGFGVGSS